MAIVLILNIVFSVAVVIAITGLLGWNIAVERLSPAHANGDAIN